MKGATIIHVKVRGAPILKILKCFRILHVQILSGFKNWDIQDLTLSYLVSRSNLKLSRLP